MADKLSTSAALRYTEQELGGPCTETETLPSILFNVPTVIAQGNGDRVGLFVLNIGGNAVGISLAAIPTASNTLILPGQGGSMSLSVKDDFTLPSRQWNAICTVGNGFLYVLEITRFMQTLDNQL